MKFFLFLFLSPFLLDQAIKIVVTKLYSSSFQCNPGIIFGLNFNFSLIIFSNFFIIVLLLLIALKEIKKNKLVPYLLVTLCGAALSNLVDRLTYGCVIDYINLGFWPVFNLSDFIISISTILVALLSFMKKNNA